jgi:hypothetical protein
MCYPDETGYDQYAYVRDNIHAVISNDAMMNDCEVWPNRKENAGW